MAQLALRLILAAVIGAGLYRLRGGGFIHTGSTQLARAFWSPTGALLAWAAGAPLWACAANLIPAFLSSALVGHAGHQDMGLVRSTDPWAPKDRQMYEWPTRWLGLFFGKESGYVADIAGLSVIGAVRAVMLAALPTVWNPATLWIVPAFAAAHPLAYVIGRFANERWLRQQDHLGASEILTGALFWFIIVGISPLLSAG